MITAETSSEPRQPRRLLKKRNMPPSCPRCALPCSTSQYVASHLRRLGAGGGYICADSALAGVHLRRLALEGAGEEEPRHVDPEGDAVGVLAGGAVAGGVLLLGATDAGRSVTTRPVPSSVDQRARSTWQAATGAGEPRWRALTDEREVITQAQRSSWSSATPTGTTCGRPSARRVVERAQVPLGPEGEQVGRERGPLGTPAGHAPSWHARRQGPLATVGPWSPCLPRSPPASTPRWTARSRPATSAPASRRAAGCPRGRPTRRPERCAARSPPSPARRPASALATAEGLPRLGAEVLLVGPQRPRRPRASRATCARGVPGARVSAPLRRRRPRRRTPLRRRARGRAPRRAGAQRRGDAARARGVTRRATSCRWRCTCSARC